MIEIICGLLATVILVVLTLLLNKYFTAKLFATAVLVAIAFIYVGFALEGDTVPLIILEISFALMLFFLAIIGYLKRPALIGYGIILHGVWDTLHHHDWIVKTEVPSYWPLFCLTIDLIYGAYLVYVFRKMPGNAQAAGS